jgi:hypothetical protein
VRNSFEPNFLSYFIEQRFLLQFNLSRQNVSSTKTILRFKTEAKLS